MSGRVNPASHLNCRVVLKFNVVLKVICDSTSLVLFKIRKYRPLGVTLGREQFLTAIKANWSNMAFEITSYITSTYLYTALEFMPVSFLCLT